MKVFWPPGAGRRRLEEVLGAGPPDGLYPEPAEHCAICRWGQACARKRREDDDLSLVAGMTTGQRRALKAAGIGTRRGFAGLAALPRLDRVGPDALGRAQAQARLQVASEDDGVIRYELLEPERDAGGALVPDRGLLAHRPGGQVRVNGHDVDLRVTQEPADNILPGRPGPGLDDDAQPDADDGGHQPGDGVLQAARELIAPRFAEDDRYGRRGADGKAPARRLRQRGRPASS